MRKQMIWCKNENCSFHIIDDKNVIDYSKESNSTLIKPLNPTVDGHMLLIPKNHIANVSGFKDYTLASFDLVKSLTKFIDMYLNGSDYDIILQSGKYGGQTVPHLHIHLVPRTKDDKTFSIDWDK